MKMSEKKKHALYGTIHEEVMKLRVLHMSKKFVTKDDFDFELAKLVDKIYSGVKQVFNVKE